MAWLINDGIVSADDLVGIDYPADLWPSVGRLSLDRSVEAGADTLDDAIKSADGPVTVVGVSQGAVVINYQKRRLMAASNPRDDIEFVTLGDPTNSDGGLQAKLPPVRVPLLDFTITPPPVDTPYATTEIVREFDGFADWPDKPFNALADANALAGIVFAHPNYGRLDLDDEDNVITRNGNATHILVKTDNLPLTEPLRALGVDDALVDKIDRPLRNVINRAYDGPRPGVTSAAKQLNNIRAKPVKTNSVAERVPSRLNEVRSSIHRLGQKRSTRKQVQQHEQPSAAAEVGEND